MTHSQQQSMILKLASNWCANQSEALYWYENSIIPSMAMTSAEAVSLGKFDELMSYLESAGINQ